MKIKVAVCDDMPVFLETTKMTIQKLRPNYELDTYDSGVGLLEAQKEYDIVFLDIEMPQMNGLEKYKEGRMARKTGRIV